MHEDTQPLVDCCQHNLGHCKACLAGCNCCRYQGSLHQRLQNNREDHFIDISMRPAVTGIEGTHIDQPLECLWPTIEGGWVNEPEHEQRGKFEIGSGCRGAQTLPLLGSQLITLHDYNPIEWGIDCSRGTPCRLQHDVNLFFFYWSPRLKITNGPAVTDYFFEFHWASSIDCPQTLTARSFVALQRQITTRIYPHEDKLHREDVHCHGCCIKTDVPTAVLRQANFAVLYLSFTSFSLKLPNNLYNLAEPRCSNWMSPREQSAGRIDWEFSS